MFYGETERLSAGKHQFHSLKSRKCKSSLAYSQDRPINKDSFLDSFPCSLIHIIGGELEGVVMLTS